LWLKNKIGFYGIVGDLVDVIEVIVNNREITIIAYPGEKKTQIVGMLPNYDVFFGN
jgi:hypothetical protein